MKKVGFIGGILIGIFVGGIGLIKVLLYENKSDLKLRQQLKRNKMYYSVLDKWLLLKEENLGVEQYFEKNCYKRIAIYGMGTLGKHLLHELDGTNVVVDYVVDNDEELQLEGIPIQTKEQPMNPVDVIVVTPTHCYDEIEKELQEKINFPIVSLDEIIFSC